MDGLDGLAAALPTLRKLTMHGSPLEKTLKGYRYRVILAIPWLRDLDFVPVGAQEREDGKIWGKSLRDAVWKPMA